MSKRGMEVSERRGGVLELTGARLAPARPMSNARVRNNAKGVSDGRQRELPGISKRCTRDGSNRRS